MVLQVLRNDPEFRRVAFNNNWVIKEWRSPWVRAAFVLVRDNDSQPFCDAFQTQLLGTISDDSAFLVHLLLRLDEEMATWFRFDKSTMKPIDRYLACLFAMSNRFSSLI